ncbi:hypothetical protein Tco_1276108 [Tanacetum coccineum]
MSMIGMNMLASKGNFPDVRKIEAFLHNVREDNETTKVGASLYRRLWPYIYCINLRIPLLYTIIEDCSRSCDRYDANLQVKCLKFDNESTGLRAEAPKMLWAYLVSMTYLIYHIPYVSIGLCIPEEEWRGKDTSLAHLKVIQSRDITFVDSIYEARAWVEVRFTQNPYGSSVGASRIVKDHMKINLKSEHPPRREALRLLKYEDPPKSPGLWSKNSRIAARRYEASLTSWAERKPRVQIEGSFVRTDSSTEATYLKFNSFMEKDKNLKVCTWAKLVRILISEGSLSLFKILRTKSVAEIFTREREVIPSLMMLVQDTLYPKSPSPAFEFITTFTRLLEKQITRVEEKHSCLEKCRGPKNDALIRDLREKLEVFNTKVENGGLEGQEIEERLVIMKQLEDKDHFISSMFKTLSNVEVGLLDAPFTTKEIKSTVWDCGGSKAPRPNGFIFKFIKLYWDTIGNEFNEMVKRFEIDGSIPKGCNSSFIALIPKIKDPLHMNDYRPISLIGCQYKVIAKVLANRIQQVVHSVVSKVQTAYINWRQIIDGPLMVN